MHALHTGFLVCPRCGMRFPVAASTPDVAHLQAYLQSDDEVRCPTCEAAFACHTAQSSIEMEPVQDGTTLDPSPVRSLDGLDNH